MLIDLRQHPEAAASSHSDVCIIGAGAAGINLARALVAKGHTVCLLESGGLDYEQATQNLYRGANVGMEYYDLVDSRLRFFGGTVAIWGGRCALYNAIDFEKRDWVPHSGWPINREAILPWYKAAHDSLELGRFNYEDNIWAEMGLAPQGFDPAKIDSVLWRFDEMAERFTASRSRDLLDGPNVRVLIHANAVRLQASADASQIDHVVAQALGGPPVEVKAHHYVLATGAIENARLLLASNDVATAGLGNSHDQVGRYFMEHPVGRIARVETPDPYGLWARFQKRFMADGPPLAPVIRLGDDAQRQHQALNSIATLKLQRDPGKGVALGNKVYHNIKHSLAPDRKGRFLDHAYRGIRAWFHRNIRGSVESLRARTGITQLYLIMRGEQAPNPDSRILLSAERDSLGNPLANLDWQLSEQDKHTGRVLVETFAAELQRLGLGTAHASAWLAESGTTWPVDPTIGNHPIGGYHHMGGTRMSASPATGVVDADCAVHGLHNLHVAGSSVFPTGGWANPTLTIIAFALRLADHLDGRLARKR